MNGDRGRRLARRVVAALSGLALLAVPAFSLALRDLWPALGPPLADQRLAAIRGGFTTPGGVQFSFGIERTVTINGEMVAITRLILDNLQNLMLGTMPTAQFATALGTVIQNGPGNSAPAATVTGSTLTGIVGNTVTTGPGAAASASPAPAQSASPIPVAAASPAPQVAAAAPTPAAPAPATVGAPVQTVQPATPAAPAPATVGAPVQTVQPATPAAPATPTAAAQPLVVQITVNGQVIQVPNGAAIALGIQNSLNNQQINTRTQIDATLSSLSALQSGQFAAALRQQILDSVRR